MGQLFLLFFAACNEAFPNFRAEYEAVLTRLATPQPITVADPLSNEPLDFALDRVLGLALVVLGNLFILQQFFYFIIGVTADVTHSNTGAFSFSRS